MISEMMRLEPFDTMESIAERALTRASETGIPQRFEFNRNLFEAQPDKPGFGTVQMIGEVERKRESYMDPRLYESITYVSREIVPSWSVADIVNVLKGTGTNYILIAGPNTEWLRKTQGEIYRSLGDSYFYSVSPRTLQTCSGITANFEVATIENEDRFLGITFSYAFLEERQKEVMGGNYNKFPYRSMDRDRARFEERQERVVRAEAKWANFKEIEQDRMAALTVKAAEERESQARYAALKPRGDGASSLASQINLQAVQQAYEQASFESMNVSEMWLVNLNEVQKQLLEKMSLSPSPRPMFKFVESPSKGYAEAVNSLPGLVQWTSSGDDMVSTWSSYAGISRSQNPEQEVLRLRGLLQTVDRVLGRHLREQLAAAPSQGSVYASGPGYAVTAFEIRQVVQALDSVSGQPQPFWLGVDTAENSADFTAESEDGEKIVLSKDGDRFDSGVLFDPANRPIRKFKLKELAA